MTRKIIISASDKESDWIKRVKPTRKPDVELLDYDELLKLFRNLPTEMQDEFDDIE